MIPNNNPAKKAGPSSRLLQFVMLLSVLLGIHAANAQTNPAAQALPHSQNFGTFSGSTTTYPAGVQGWTITGTLATTFPTAAPTADQALAAGTNATTTAGVYDMNGKIGLVSTGSNLRAIALALNTTGFSSIAVTFDAATQAQIAAGRINELGLQYRIGTTGTFTNVTGSTYQNDALTSINSGTAASSIQNISVTLPAAADNQAVVQLRWVIRDVTGTGNRPTFSVDNISVTGTPLSCTTPDPVTSLSGTNANTSSALTWTNGGCLDENMVVVSSAPFTAAVPSGNGSAYTANSTNFTDALNTTFDGGKVVYKGAAISMTVTALTNGTTYYVKVFTRKGSNWTAGTTTTVTPTGGTPTITVTPTSVALVTSAGNPSMPGSYNVSGTNLSNDIIITAPAGVEISTAFFGPYSGTLNLTPSSGSVASTKIWVRLTGAAYTTGTVANATTGGTTQSVTITGTVNTVTVTELLVPQLMQGLNGTNSNRVPYLFRVTLSGLLPNATYRYFPGVVDSTDTYTASGAGAPIFVDNQSSFTQSSGGAINTVGGYSTFTTNGSGSYTGWFGIAPTGNARFVPGRSLYVRITMNNGAGGTSAANYVTLPSPIKIQDLVAGRAQPLFGVSSALEKNFVMIYDNTAGTGRPIASSTVENDGAIPNSYAGFYNSQVNAVTGAWGTLIPSNLPNGIRRIEQRDFATGSIIGCATDADGVWATGSVNTVNPSGGTTAIQIASADAPLTCCIGGPTATVTLSVSSNNMNENGGSVIITATACTAVTGAQTVQVTLGGTATNSSDYTLSNTAITIANGQTTGTVTLTSVNDALVEGTETIILTLTNPSSGLVLGTPITQTVSIIDDDVPVATLTASTNTTNESAAATITLTVTTDNPTLASETFTLNFTGTATVSSDYTASATTVTIPSGSTTGFVTITIINDALREADETIIVTLTTASTSVGIGSPNSQTIALVDDDDAILLTGINVTTATSTFDELAISGTGISFLTNMPRGAYFGEVGTNSNTTYRADNGSANTGDTYSFGTTGSSDRTMGSLTSGSLNPAYVAIKFQNNTGTQINALKVNYWGEQWRLGNNGFTGTNRDRLAFEYSTDATSVTTGTWQSAPQLTFYAPNTTGTAGPLDGNLAANRTFINDTVFVGGVASGSTFWVRWKDIDVVGGDDGLAVDDASFTPIFFTPSVYYSKSTGDLNDISTWGNQTNGGGLSPTNFTASGQTFIVANQANATIASNWVVSGAGSKVIVSTGYAFTIPSNATLTGTIDIEANATLVIENATSPTFGILDENSTVVYGANAPVVQVVSSVATFGNLTFTGTGTHVIGSSLRVANQLLFDNGIMDQNNVSNFYVIYFRRDLTVNAGVTYSALYNSNVSLQPYGNFKQTVKANGGNTVNASRFLMNVNNAGGSLITSGIDLKTDTLQLDANTTLMLTHLKLNTNAAAFFLDNSNTIKASGDVEAAGTIANYSFTGTIELIGSTATSNFRQDNNTGSTAVIKAQLNNILVNTTGNADVKFQPQTGAGTVVIKGNVTLDGSSTNPIRLYNNNYHLKGNFTNNRSVDVIDQGTSNVVFNGDINQQFTTSFVAGDTLYKVQINKSSGDVFLNGGDLVVTNNFTGTDALLKTNVNKLVLGNTATIVENDSAYVLGNVWTTRFLNQNVNNTFGGLGIEINALNLVPGSTLVKRITGIQLPLGCFVSIKRQFEIFPTVNNNMNATVKIAYLEDPELNGLEESFLRLFQQPNFNGPWTVNYNAIVNAAGNFVTTTNVQSFDRYTLANPQPSAGTATAAGATPGYFNTVICSGNNVVLTLNGSIGNIQWQESPDGTANWSNITGATNPSYTTAALSTTTYFRAVVTNPCWSISSNTVAVQVSTTPTVTIQGLTSTTASVNWTPFVAGKYNLAWSGAAGSGSQLNVTDVPFVITALVPGQSFSVTVTQAAPGCAGTVAASASAQTLCSPPVVTSVQAWDTTFTSGATQRGLAVTWTPVSGATGYRIMYRPLLLNGNWSTVDVGNVTQRVIRPLYASMPYAVRVAALNCPAAGQTGESSAVHYGTTTNPQPACGPKPFVNAVSNCPGQLTVSIVGGAGPWRITFRRLTPSMTAPVAYNTSSPLFNLSVGIQYASTVWEVMAQSYCGTAKSAVSDVTLVTVKPACSAPQNLVLSSINCQGFAASWNADGTNCNGNGITSYYIYIKKQGSVNANGYSTGLNNVKLVQWLGAGTYTVWVRTQTCNGALSAPSTGQDVTVPPCRDDEETLPVEGDDLTYAGAGVAVFPNPSNGDFTVAVQNPGNDGLVSIEIVDLLGRAITHTMVTEANGPVTAHMVMPANTAAGLYLVRTLTGGTVTTTRININK